MAFIYKQKFHAVGQGLFYSSALSNDNATANIVFDCGSDKTDCVNREVIRYKEEVATVNLLILSHLHYDHVSGLDELFKDTKVKVDTIVLPYLNKYERILLQLENDTTTQWYNKFLENPYTWLSEKNISNIVIVNGNSEIDDNLPNINFEEIDSENEIFTIHNNLQTTQIESDESISTINKVSICNTGGYVQIANLYFKFFNYKTSEEKLNNFKKKIEELGINDTKSALNFLKDATKRKYLEEAYKQIEKYDLNKTSLVAYQGFIFPKNKDHISFKVSNNCMSHPMIFGVCCCEDCDCFVDGHFHGYISRHKYRYDLHCHCLCHNNHKNILGTLLLGDIKLDYKKTNRKDDLFYYFKSLLKTVQLIQLSHHGANNGWNKELINQIKQSCTYVASHAIKNRYNHPHKEVLIKLARKQRRYISVTECDEYCSEFEIS
jgi:metal-dependent hydrolase (beta-lactamase superfamily II)